MHKPRSWPSNSLSHHLSLCFDFFPQCSIAFHLPYLRLIEKLLPVMPDPSLDSFYLWNSGTEAIEATLKMARSITGRQNIISMQGMRSRGTAPQVCVSLTLHHHRWISRSYLWCYGCYEEQDCVQRRVFSLDGGLLCRVANPHVIPIIFSLACLVHHFLTGIKLASRRIPVKKNLSDYLSTNWNWS